VHPPAGWQVDFHGVFAGDEGRRYHKVRSDHKLVVQAVHFRIIGVVHEGVPDDGEAVLGGFFDQLHPIRFPGCVDLGEVAEVSEGLVVGVDLVVHLGPVALVGAEYGSEGAELDPAHEQLFRTVVPEQGVIYGGVAADIRVVEAVAR
jgi:hypothetical protein